MRISQKTLDKCETTEDLLNLQTNNGKENYSSLGNKGQDYRTFYSRYEFFKDRINTMLPEMTIEEVLKFDEMFMKYKDAIHSFYGFNEYLAVLEFEHKKGLLK